MTSLLCRWLNEDVRLSLVATEDAFAKDFSNGYLFGEILNAYGLQSDFASFLKSSLADCKLNNFLKLEPPLRQLNIAVEANMIYDIMMEKPSIGSRLAYQLYAILNKTAPNSIVSGGKTIKTSTGLATLSASAGSETLKKASYRAAERQLFETALKRMTLRQTDLDSLSGQARFAEKQKLHVDSLLRKVKEDEVKKMAVVKGVYEANMERAREVQRQADERLKPLLTGTSTFQRGGGNNITQRKEAAEAASHPVMPQEALVLVAPMPMLMKETLRQHSSDSVQAKADQDHREKRRRRLLVAELENLEHLSQGQRDATHAAALARQALDERRVAAMLLATRREQAVIVENRIFLKQQQDARRENDFRDALNRQREQAAEEKLAFAALIAAQATRAIDDQVERSALRSAAHQKMCRELVTQLVEFIAHIASYQEMSQKTIPPVMLREWRALFLAGQDPCLAPTSGEATLLNLTAKLPYDPPTILDDAAFHDYHTVTQDWSSLTQPPGADRPANSVLEQVLRRITAVAYPPKDPKDRVPVIGSRNALRVVCIGKAFSGKETVISQVAPALGLTVIRPAVLVSDALGEYTTNQPAIECYHTAVAAAAAHAAVVSAISTRKCAAETALRTGQAEIAAQAAAAAAAAEAATAAEAAAAALAIASPKKGGAKPKTPDKGKKPVATPVPVPVTCRAL